MSFECGDGIGSLGTVRPMAVFGAEELVQLKQLGMDGGVGRVALRHVAFESVCDAV